MKLIVATGNKNKLLEFERILTPLGIEVLSLVDAGISEFDVDETGDTFADNAKIKALAMYELTGLPVVADDSGICVDALGGRPGVHSARYLGSAPQSEKNAALLKELENVPDEKRSACFMCNIYCIITKDTHITSEGRCAGKIAYAPSGDGGFGYDPIFLVGEKSFAALSDAEKDIISHRGIALRELAKKLEAYLKNKEKINDNNETKG